MTDPIAITADLLDDLQEQRKAAKTGKEVAIRIGNVVVHRGPAEWMLQNIPAPLAENIRILVAKGFRLFGEKFLMDDKTLYGHMNNKMFMNTINPKSGDLMLEEVPENYVENLFPRGKESEWPQQLVFCTKDIAPSPETMQRRMENIPNLVEKLLAKDKNNLRSLKESAAGKIVVLATYHTDTVLNNGADVLDRVRTIRKDPLSMEGMSPAATLMGKSILDLLTQKKHGESRVLRSDAPDIMRHIMLHGFSQGGNVTSDAFRFLRHQMRTEDISLALDAEGTRVSPLDNDDAIAKIFAGSYILNLAAADVPFSRAELSCMPPRDNIRADGDLVISGAVGLNKQQSNYNYLWRQDDVNLLRNDRLLEAIGPVKKLLGFKSSDKDYIDNLGHFEPRYWEEAVDQAKTSLQERLAARFSDKAVANDVTFGGGTIKIDFERGTSPATMIERREALVQKLAAEGIEEVPSSSPSPYKIRLKAPEDFASLHAIDTALKSAGILATKEVGHMLNIDNQQQWLQRVFDRAMPDAKVSSRYSESGPVFDVTVEEGFGQRVHQHFLRGMKKLEIPGEYDVSKDGKSVTIIGHGVIAGLKAAEMRKHRSLNKSMDEIAL